MMLHIFCSCARPPLYEGFEQKATAEKGAAKGATGPKTKGAAAAVAAGKLKNAIKPNVKEGFTVANINNGNSEPYNLYQDVSVNTSAWSDPSLTYAKGGKPNTAAQSIFNRPTQPVPLPEGELVFFANNQFKPECCPNSYSNGSGCACMTVNQYKYLIDRGGNNVPYSEY